MNSLINFLNKHETDENCTHTSIIGSKWIIGGKGVTKGKWMIPDNENENFFKIYTSALNENTNTEFYITELHLPSISPVIIDFDFEFKKSEEAKLLKYEVIKGIVENLTLILQQMFGQKPNYSCFVLRRRCIYKQKDKWKYGLHLQFPYIVTTYDCQYALRDRFLETYKLQLSTTNELESIYDKSIIKHTVWCMYLSTKPGKVPYKLKWIFNDDDLKVDNFDTLTLVKLFSIRNKTNENLIKPTSLDIIHKYMTKETITIIDNPERYYHFRIENYLNFRKEALGNCNLNVLKVIKKDNICGIVLDHKYCPFIKADHNNKSLFITVSNAGLTLRCKECLVDKIHLLVSRKFLINVFGLKPIEEVIEMVEEDIQTSNFFKNTDEILLMDANKYMPPTLIEHSKHITNETIDKIKSKNTLVLMSPTGSGKTRCIQKILKYVGDDAKILSVISRRSMSSLHKNTFKNMTSYLDDPKEINLNRYIVSLEQIHKSNIEYDVLVLDEITSLISHFYSRTMEKRRLVSFIRLVELISKTKKVICCDAIMTDMTMAFIGLLRDIEDIVYYRNIYKNKNNINLHINYKTNNKTMKEIEIFCRPIVDKIKKNEEVMIMSDSKTIVNNIYNYLLEFNDNKSYYQVYTKDSGILSELEDCNKTWKGKCVLYSPKIIYGIDVLIQYEDIYAIYQGNSICGFSMLQQISRARNTQNVHVLFLQSTYKDKLNKYISYEQNKYIEESQLNKYMTNFNSKYDSNKITKSKENILFELQAIQIGNTGNNIITSINENNIFGKIHLYASWYRRIFSQNKSQLFIQLCIEQGYTIHKHEFAKETSKCNIINVKAEINKEIVEQTEKILDAKKALTNQIIDPEQREQMLKEELRLRMGLMNLNDVDLLHDESLKEIVIDRDRFERCIKSIVFYYNEETINNKEIESYAKNFTFIEKSNKLFKILDAIRWLEKKLEVDRFNVCQLEINYNDMLEKAKDKSKVKEKIGKQIENIKNDMMENINMFRNLGFRKDDHQKRIAKINSLDRLMKFFVQIINTFDKFYSYKKKRVGKKRRLMFYNFKLNDILNDHIQIINRLNIDPKKFIINIRNKIVKKTNLEMLIL